MKFETKNIDDLSAYDRNSRTHSAKQVASLAASITEFGMAGVIVVRDGTIAKGHGTTAAIRSIYESGESLYPSPGKAAGAAPFPPGTVPVIDATGWTDEQFRAFVIADNQLALDAGWDTDILREEVGELLGAEYDLDLLGFDDDFLAELLREDEEQEENDRDPNVVAQAPSVAVTRPGDVWTLGPHRIMCGDSTNADDVARLMNGEQAVLLHADPPYGMGKQKDGVQNDNLYAEKLDAFQMRWWAAWRPHIVDNASAYIWGNAPELWRLWYKGGLAESEKILLRNEITWDKQSAPGMKSGALPHMYAEASERCLFMQLGEQLLGAVNSADYWEGWDELRLYLAAEADAVGLTPAACRAITGVQMYPHWFSKSQWSMINAKYYGLLQAAFPANFRRDHTELYERYRELRRGFNSYVGGIVGGIRSYFDNAHDIMRDTWHFQRVVGEDRHGHATPKPVAMMKRVCLSSAPEGGLVAEPFAGSGSTLMGAEDSGRRCFTMELTPAYVDVTVKRWQDYTGHLAFNEKTGRPFNE